jgi:hypothetical protein
MPIESDAGAAIDSIGTQSRIARQIMKMQRLRRNPGLRARS